MAVQHSFELAKGPCDDDGRPMRTGKGLLGLVIGLLLVIQY